jgi:hypothetical protein
VNGMVITSVDLIGFERTDIDLKALREEHKALEKVYETKRKDFQAEAHQLWDAWTSNPNNSLLPLDKQEEINQKRDRLLSAYEERQRRISKLDQEWGLTDAAYKAVISEEPMILPNNTGATVGRQLALNAYRWRMKENFNNYANTLKGSLAAGFTVTVYALLQEVQGKQAKPDALQNVASTTAQVEGLVATRMLARGRVSARRSSYQNRTEPQATTTGDTKTPLLTMSDGYYLGRDMGQAWYTAVYGKYPGNIRFVNSNAGTYSVDRPWGWTRTYNAGAVRGHLESGGNIRFTSQQFTGTFGLEADQVLGIHSWLTF